MIIKQKIFYCRINWNFKNIKYKFKNKQSKYNNINKNQMINLYLFNKLNK